MKIHLAKQRWKIFLLVLAIVIGFASLFITNSLVKELSIEERKKIELWAEAIRQLSQINDLNDSCQNFSIIMEVIDNNTTVPVILANEDDEIIGYNNIKPRFIESKESATRLLSSMKASKEPIEVTLLDGTKNYVYYKDSTTLVRLTYYPYVQLFVIVLFVLISYYAFNQSRKSEQNQVWVGMAKETAHQLGTPTSSLLAWLEIIKDTDLHPELVTNFENDVARLEKIVNRFSKIGSSPSLESTNLVTVIDSSIDYLRNRISKKVAIEKLYQPNDIITAPINRTLFEWVLENIIKNSVDAIESKGEVKVSIVDNTQVVFIDIVDSGKGIPKSHFKTIFQPGFTTKARGWGLGLTLSKRIVEVYHRGKIFVNSSEVGKGSTFRIVLKK
ncbi:MAG: HAMP domain-containing sensor histidine kinase [Perlabentimonas sp.]